MTTFASAPFALFIGVNITSACARLAFSNHSKFELIELALTIVAPTTHSTPLDSYRGDVLINLQECVPPKRNDLGVSRGHAGQEEENEARDGGAQHDTLEYGFRRTTNKSDSGGQWRRMRVKKVKWIDSKIPDSFDSAGNCCPPTESTPRY